MTGASRVLVTGGTGAFGTSTTSWLTRAGHDVVVFARNPPMQLPRGAVYTQGDIRDRDAVRRAMLDCDAVVHLAWTLSGSVTHEQAAPLDIGGTRNVLDAMQDTNCSRLVFASSVTAYGAHPEHTSAWTEDEPLDPAPGLVYEWHKAQAESLILDSGVEAVRVRPTVVVGRHALNGPANVYRQLVIPSLGGRAVIQTVHQDDVGRFFASACTSAATGAVNLAARDVLTWPELAALAERPLLRTSPRVVMATMRAAASALPVARSAPELFDLFLHWPVADTTRLERDFGFTPAWTSAQAVADQGRTSRSYILLGMKQLRRPTRLDRGVLWAPATGSRDGRTTQVIDASTAGEFDTTQLDPDYPEWTCANVAEAFPGTLTPLSLHLITELMLTSADVVARTLPLPPAIRENMRTRQIGVFGHRIYHNMSVMREVIEAVPGQTTEDFDYQICGQAYPDGYVRPRPKPADLLGYAKFAATAGPRLAGLDHEVGGVVARARELAAGAAERRALSDAGLLSQISVLWDDTVRGWQVGNLCTFMVSAPTSILERRYGAAGVTTLRDPNHELSSAALLRGIRALAGAANAAPAVSALLRTGVDSTTWAALRREAPAFAAQVQRLLDECGHRGPGETELANLMFADAPELLLRAIAGSLDAPPRRSSAPMPSDAIGRRLAAAALSAINRRERCRDAVTLTTHQLRLALREWGHRLAASGVIEQSSDVFYLAPAELYSTSDLTATVSRRRAERERLAALPLPTRFSGTITMTQAREAIDSGSLSGVAASPGSARGRVRRMRTADDELEPGEILVATATDTGWTPFFGVAAAVVTDIGGLMSHASIVAREFGIPAVVGVSGAFDQLRDGQLIDVDGTTGTITVLEPAPPVGRHTA